MGAKKTSEAAEESVRALKVVLPAELKTQIKLEAVELDILVRDYVRQILEDRLPWRIRQQVAEQAELKGMSYQDFLIQALRDAHVIR